MGKLFLNMLFISQDRKTNRIKKSDEPDFLFSVVQGAWISFSGLNLKDEPTKKPVLSVNVCGRNLRDIFGGFF